MRPDDRALFGRRALLAAAGACLFTRPAGAADTLSALERSTGGRLGVYVLDIASGRSLAWRATERFPMCSTFKALLAGAVLARVDLGKERLDRRLPLSPADLIDHAPVSHTHVGAGYISVGEAAKAAVQVSDNTAANLLLKTVGGPAGLTAFLRAVGDRTTRLDRTEPALNSAIPGDPRDTTTPMAMATTLRGLLLGRALSPTSRQRLTGWMLGTSTGLDALRKDLPAGWKAADKTGSGTRGTRNDAAIFWSPQGQPVLAAAYLTGATSLTARQRDAVMADVGRRAVALHLGRT